MTLAPGTRLGSYDIVAALGAGGMGEVFRARDTRLGREVALKVLPDQVAGDPERLNRFQREAKTLAALNHPHIAQVYGFEEFRTGGASAPASSALVMELVPGESLAARLGRGPVPMPEALELARQIAEGLGAAHEQGIVHRDLKPANVQVTPDGVAKLLDFGLAKPLPEGRGFSPGPTDDAATLTSPAPMTEAGVVLGTAAYMSPEQARGLAVDTRTDIWAFGCVLYEMLTGTRAIPGTTTTDLLVAILERDPDWTRLPATTPPPVRALLRRCLRKSPKQRLRDIADARFVLEDALAALSSGAQAPAGALGAGTPGASAPRAIWHHPLPLGLALTALALGGALAWSVTRTPAPAQRMPQYLSLTLPPDQRAAGGFALSPDGRAVVYGAVADEGPPGPMGDVQRLYYRRLADPEARMLPGTESGTAMGFSPDGEWVAFVSRAEPAIKKISLRGGGPVVLTAEGIIGTGGMAGRVHWTDEGQLLVPNSVGPLLRLPAAGGAPEPLIPRTALERGEEGFSYPYPLPRSGDLLFGPSTSTGGIAAWVGGRRQPLIKDAFNPQLVGNHLLFWRRASPSQLDLSAVVFDANRVALVGESVPVLSLSVDAGWSYALSPSGTLVYRPAGASRAIPPDWHSLGEAPAPLAGLGPAPPGTVSFGSPRVSPDGRRVLVSRTIIGRGSEIAVHDVVSGTRRVLATPPSAWTTWSHDGRRVIFQAGPDSPGGAGLLWVPLDGSAPAERLTSSKAWQQPQTVTRDGRFLIYQETGGLGRAAAGELGDSDIWLLSLTPRGQPRPLLQTAANERLPHLSPDDRWMAYVSDESGRNEVWVRAFPDGEGAIRVSQEGGNSPIWAPDGRTLYYRDGGFRLFAVPVTPGTPPQFGLATVTQGYWVADSEFGRHYDITPDGGALLFLPGPAQGRELGVVLNFDEVIRRKLEEAASR